ncbi:MAG: MarR family transcriptional regulator [Patescibacteria group bacterium]|jgi:DNA-binding MarR family transcriptional regulator
MAPPLERSKVLEQLFEDFAIIKRKFSRESPTHAHLLAHSQWIALGIIFKQGPLTIKALTKELNVSQSAATQVVDSLVEKKLVTRIENKKDRRSVSIILAPSARAMAVKMKQRIIKNLTEVFSPLSDEEFKTYAKLHRRIAENIKP